MALSVALVVGVSAYFGYRTYEYVQHDNEFCLSCHLMVEPYQRFARSEHRDLGCKSCHKPTLVARSKMALTQVLENPEKLEEHAVVDNGKCEACHVRGAPEKWEQIASTAGHRVHLESRDTALKDVRCVKCHSSAVHEFAATEKTCAQGGCHEKVQIRLGKMSQLTLHCAMCHDFKREIAQDSVPRDSLQHALAPNARECLGCHQMRRLVADEFTGDDPHDAQCALCHDPHKQRTPRDAAQSCASSGCHSEPEKVTPMHRGLRAGVLQQCTQCHSAHKFIVPTGGCAGCHRDIMAEPASPITKVARQQQSRFSHARHRQVACTSCHSSTQQHGAVTVRTAQQCQSCHHGAQQVANRCSSCHQAGDYGNRTYRITQRVSLSTGQPRVRTRTLPFEHGKHSRVECAQCHRDPLTRSAANVQCNACHQEHHKTTASCLSCHQAARVGAHTTKVHVGCGGSGCHATLPVAGVPRTRQFCLTCHQQLVNHKPSGNCADCHRLPTPRS